MEQFPRQTVLQTILVLGCLSYVLFIIIAMRQQEGPGGVAGKTALQQTAESEEEAARRRANAPPEYVGIDSCKICHLPHYESWSTTKMSRTFELLKPGVRAEAKAAAGLDPQKDFTHDEECLVCHVTGYGKPGGFVSIEETPEMANVECEMCHGPGSKYAEMMLKVPGTYTLDDFKEKGGLTMPSAENNVCTDKCHNPKSPFIGSGFDFDFEDRKAMGTHKHDLEYIYLPFDL